MAQHIAVLRGWHPALAMAELTALLPNHYPMASESNRLAILEGSLNPNEAFETLSASSGCQAILLNGFIHNWQDDQSILLGKIETYLQMNKREGKMAVVPLRIEGKISQFSSSKIAGKIGAIMSDMGCQIDLSNPQHRFQ